MKIIYIANARIPTEKAHGFQIMKMCEEFSNLGNAVELVVPMRFNKIEKDPFDFYSIKKNFKIKKLFSLDLLPFENLFGRFSFYLQNLSFTKRATLYCAFKKADIIFSRDLLSSLFLSILGKKVCFEVHDAVPVNWLTNKYFKKIYRVVSTNRWKRTKIMDLLEINTIPGKQKNIQKINDILVVPNGVDLEKFDINKTKEDCRRELSIPQKEKIILYVGHLYDWKGVDVLFEVAKKSKNYLFGFVGGTDEDIEKYKNISKDFKNIKFFGMRPHSEIPSWLRASDILVIPNSKKVNEMQARATSPIKLFEYLASGTPIIASHTSAINEIVTEDHVWLFEPDDISILNKRIIEVLNKKEDAKIRAEKAKVIVKQYTWQKRAQRIVEFLEV